MGIPKKPAPTKNDIIVIAKRCIDEYDGKLVKRLDDQDDTLAEQNKVLNEHGLQLNTIQNQIREIYGNGSGKKGILDTMKEVQSTQACRVEQIQETISSEKTANELFRVEVRNALKIRDSEVHTRTTVNNRWIRSLKWIITPLGVVIWELFKAKFHIGEK